MINNDLILKVKNCINACGQVSLHIYNNRGTIFNEYDMEALYLLMRIDNNNIKKIEYGEYENGEYANGILININV